MKKFVSFAFVLLMITLSVMPAFAVVSPQGTFVYDVTVEDTPGGGGDYEYKTDIDEDGNQHVQVKPDPKPGYVFDHWEIDGDYSTDGKLTDEILELIISGDIKVKPVYKKVEGSTSVIETGTVKTDNSPTSPQTGSNDFLPYAVIILSLAACSVIAVKLVRGKKN